MKNLLTILLILLPLSAHAWGVVVTSGGVAAVGSCESCSTATDEVINISSVTVTDNDDSSIWIAEQVVFAGAQCITGGIVSCTDAGATGYSAVFELFTDNAGSPGSRVEDGYICTLTSLPDTTGDVEFPFAATQDLPAGTYWKVFKRVAGTKFGIAASGTGTQKYSSNSGSSWTNLTGNFYVRLGLTGCTQ